MEFANSNDLVLTNTLFRHKMAHRTTWECPLRKNETNYVTANGKKEIRRNPYRNQIDYIMINNKYRRYVHDSRSYNGIATTTDHKMVMTKLDLKIYMEGDKTTNNNRNINIKSITNETNANKYRDVVTNKINSQPKSTEPDKMWNDITKICKESALETLGTVSKKKKSTNPIIQQLSQEQQKLKKDKDSAATSIQKQQIGAKRNNIMKEIHRLLREEEENEINDKLQQIENHKNNPAKMFEAARQLHNMGNKKTLTIENEAKELITNPKEQIKLVTS